jgi:hypothetical protein
MRASALEFGRTYQKARTVSRMARAMGRAAHHDGARRSIGSTAPTSLRAIPLARIARSCRAFPSCSRLPNIRGRVDQEGVNYQRGLVATGL